MKREPFEQNQSCLPPKEGEPPLHRAARMGEDAAIRELVREGADVNELFDVRLDPGGRHAMATPLMVAAGSGYGATVQTMRLLSELGANESLATDFGSIARFAAGGLGWNYLPGGDVARLQYCLSLGCDPNEIDRRGVSLIADAANTGDVQRVRVLIEAGANPNIAPNAIVGGLPKMENIPNYPFDDNAPFSFQIPLHNAVLTDAFEMVTILLAAGAQVHTLDRGRETALFNAQSAKVAQVLIDAGLNLEHANCLGWTPLVVAINDGSVDGVRAFLSVGANVNATHDRGFTVFMSAVSSSERNLEILRLLIEAGADPRAVTDLGWNAFHAAVDVNGPDANRKETVEATYDLLVQLGVDINHRDHTGETPLLRALHFGTEIEVEALRKRGAKT